MVFLSSCTACESCEWVLDAYKILGASKNDAAWKKKKKKALRCQTEENLNAQGEIS